MISTMISKFHAEADAPLSPVLSADGSVPTAAGGSGAGTIQDQPSNFPRNNSMPSITELESKEMRAAKSLSTRSSTEFEADIRHPGSAYEPIEDAAEISASASRDGPIEDIAKQGDSELPQVHEDTSMEYPLKCDALFELADQSFETVTDAPLHEDMPATPPTTPLPPVMDRISGPSSSFPYYATPKIMVHKPSQSSEGENPSSRTIDEVLANERQSLPQESNSQAPHSAQDSHVISSPPMQPMSLRPIAWQAPKDQEVKKSKLYLRKLRNAVARKTFLKITLGRQLAIPTKQMLRLLANGENVTVPDLSKPGVEAATMLVPQEAVGSITGAVLLPQGLAGAVSDS